MITDKKTFVVVDDSKTILKLYQELLGRQGHFVYASLDPFEGLELIKKHRPDMILTDYIMPGMTGEELCAKIKSIDELKEIPIIMLTGQEGDEFIIKAINAGADDYLYKKTSPQVILIKIKAVLRIYELKKELVELNQVMAIQNLVRMLGHEFNNVLTIVMGFLKSIKRKKEYQNDREVQRLEKPLLRLAELIKDTQNIDRYKVTSVGETAPMLDIKESTGKRTGSKG